MPLLLLLMAEASDLMYLLRYEVRGGADERLGLELVMLGWDWKEDVLS